MEREKRRRIETAAPVDLDERFRAAIRRIQLERDWTVLQVAHASGLSQQNLSRVMSGGGTSLLMAGKLCAWLGRDIGEVLGTAGTTPRAPTDSRKLVQQLARLAVLDGAHEAAEWLTAFAEESRVR